jgi:hypothetical protein
MHAMQSERSSAGMTPDTVHHIAQEIRHFRALLTVEETWAQHQGRNETVTEVFRRINFWRAILKVAEDRLSR